MTCWRTSSVGWRLPLPDCTNVHAMYPGWAGYRQDLESVYLAGVEAVRGESCVDAWLAGREIPDSLHVVSIGKAAVSMLKGVLRRHGEKVSTGLVITKAGSGEENLRGDTRFTVVTGGHPLPTQESLQAGEMLRDCLQGLPGDAHVLVLLSGGASSLVELLPEGISFEDLVSLNTWLLGSGLDICDMNRVRTSVSLLKGGGALAFLGERNAQVLLISDVPGDAPAFIGSGPFYSARDRGQLPASLPRDMLEITRRCPRKACEMPKGREVPHYLIATLDDALQAAASRARSLGYPATIETQRLSGDAVANGIALVSALRELPPGVHLWGGETSVSLPRRPGIGGRCQQLVLAAATAMQEDDNMVILAAGTDGSDYREGVAGAVAGPGVLADASARQSALRTLEAADSGSFLGRAGLLVTGKSTGTNVADIVIGMKYDEVA